MSAQNCNECQHFSAINQQCRRNPPLPVILGADANGQPMVAGMWPAVRAEDWCGEFHRVQIVE